jgi:hypothetical protein
VISKLGELFVERGDRRFLLFQNVGDKRLLALLQVREKLVNLVPLFSSGIALYFSRDAGQATVTQSKPGVGSSSVFSLTFSWRRPARPQETLHQVSP